MAVTSVKAPTIDLESSSSYNIRLGSSFLKVEETSRFSSVRYNHRPQIRTKVDARVVIKPSKKAGFSNLSIDDGEQRYIYNSALEDGDNHMHVLVPHGKGKDMSWVLEKLNHGHVYNLTATCTGKGAAKLAEGHPQLPLGRQDCELTEFGKATDEQADPSNPFDYRHFLKAAVKQPGLSKEEAAPNAVDTAHAAPRPAKRLPTSRPKRPDQTLFSQRKRKLPAESQQSEPKRAKSSDRLAGPSASASGRPKPTHADAPRIRVDRKASLRRTSYDDSGELILENETPISEKPSPPRGAMALALSGQLGQGPISLHSAASSPASFMASPVPSSPPDMGDEAEFGFGEVSGRAGRREGDEADKEDDDDDADADVEDLELPSPAQAHTSSAVVAVLDDEDDLGKELALALGEDDVDATHDVPTERVESEEESEEE